ncbi:hypothetical protein ACFWPA_04670 [Rhodococcus sp. NPDC058505]|uniref:hypothetical protein n=1 Tax=unclassified Rhodococcus (in: high G+C Gram-positive bacteria) TaxID=192944 RepID=UPI00365199E9
MSEPWVDEYDSDYDARPDGPAPRWERPRRRGRSAPARALQALSGAVTAGVVLLTVVVIVAAYLGSRRGFPGPGAESVTVHAVAAVAVVLAQRVADHRRGAAAAAGSVAVFLITAGLFWTQWWG